MKFLIADQTKDIPPRIRFNAVPPATFTDSSIDAFRDGLRITYATANDSFVFDLTEAETTTYWEIYNRRLCFQDRLGKDPKFCPPSKPKPVCTDLKLSPEATAYRTEGLPFIEMINAQTGVKTITFTKGSKIVVTKKSAISVRGTPLAPALAKHLASKNASGNMTANAETKIYRCIAKNVMGYDINPQSIATAVCYRVD